MYILKKIVSIRMKEEDYLYLEMLAKINQENPRTLIRKILEDYIRKDKNHADPLRKIQK